MHPQAALALTLDKAGFGQETHQAQTERPTQQPVLDTGESPDGGCHLTFKQRLRISDLLLPAV